MHAPRHAAPPRSSGSWHQNRLHLLPIGRRGWPPVLRGSVARRHCHQCPKARPPLRHNCHWRFHRRVGLCRRCHWRCHRQSGSRAGRRRMHQRRQSFLPVTAPWAAPAVTGTSSRLGSSRRSGNASVPAASPPESGAALLPCSWSPAAPAALSSGGPTSSLLAPPAALAWPAPDCPPDLLLLAGALLAG